MLRSRCCAEFTISMTWKELVRRAEEERAGTRPPTERYGRMVEIFEIVGSLKGVLYYRCRRLDPYTMRCTDYADRLPICTRYGSPSSPCTHENCGGAGDGLPPCPRLRLQDVGAEGADISDPLMADVGWLLDLAGDPTASHENPSPKPEGPLPPPPPPPPAPPRSGGPRGG